MTENTTTKTRLQNLPVFRYELERAKTLDVSAYGKCSFDPNYMSQGVARYLRTLQAEGKITITITINSAL